MQSVERELWTRHEPKPTSLRRMRARPWISFRIQITPTLCVPFRPTFWTAIDSFQPQITRIVVECPPMSENLLSRLEQSLRQSRAARMHLAARLRELETEADSVRAELAE